MGESIKNVLVFATNIKTKKSKQTVATKLNKITSIEQWNIDQQDVDCVLRVVSPTLSANEIISLITNQNFNCTELQ